VVEVDTEAADMEAAVVVTEEVAMEAAAEVR